MQKAEVEKGVKLNSEANIYKSGFFRLLSVHVASKFAKAPI